MCFVSPQEVCKLNLLVFGLDVMLRIFVTLLLYWLVHVTSVMGLGILFKTQRSLQHIWALDLMNKKHAESAWV